MRSRTAPNVVAFIICLVVVGLIGMATRSGGTVTRWYTGGPDAAVISSPDFDVRVRDVQVAHSVVFEDETSTTEGVFVVVEWEAAIKRQSANFRPVRLVARDGTAFDHRDEFLAWTGLPRATPGFTAIGTSVFQVWPDQLDGAAMTIERSQGVLFTHGAGVRIDDIVPDDVVVRDSVTLRAASVEVTQ